MAENKNGREQAFPRHGCEGMTKREYFAALAMHGLCANNIPGAQHNPDILANESLEYADALLKALEQK